MYPPFIVQVFREYENSELGEEGRGRALLTLVRFQDMRRER